MSGLVVILFVLVAGSLRWWYGWPGWALALLGFVVYMFLGLTRGPRSLGAGGIDPVHLMFLFLIIAAVCAIVVFGDRRETEKPKKLDTRWEEAEGLGSLDDPWAAIQKHRKANDHE